MAKLDISTKRFAISKANTQMVIVTSVAAFITVFCLVAAGSLWNQRGYQSRVIAAEDKTHTQLASNVKAVKQLVASYKSFATKPTNVIGGTIDGTAPNSGDNPEIILDALPSQYDFPALTSSIEKILSSFSVTITSIGGTDDELAQQSNDGSSTPQPVPIPFSFAISQANYTTVQQLIAALQASIRPIQIDDLALSGGANDMTLTVDAHTYYQPPLTLQNTTEVVK